MPATDRRGLGSAKESLNHAHARGRRDDIAAAVAAYDRDPPDRAAAAQPRMPRPDFNLWREPRRHRLRKTAACKTVGAGNSMCSLSAAVNGMPRPVSLDPLLAEIPSLRWRQPRPFRTSRTDSYPGVPPSRIRSSTE